MISIFDDILKRRIEQMLRELEIDVPEDREFLEQCVIDTKEHMKFSVEEADADPVILKQQFFANRFPIGEYGRLFEYLSRHFVDTRWQVVCVIDYRKGSRSGFKTELVFHREYATRDQARLDIFEYIEVFYNRSRHHSALDYQTPVNFEAFAP